MEEIKEVLRRLRRSEAIREIARQGIADRKTVRRYVTAVRRRLYFKATVTFLIVPAHTVQYYEVYGNRGLYKDGAITTP